MTLSSRVFLLLVALVFTLAGPSAAQAETRTMTLRYGPVAMGGFNVEFPKVKIRAPGVDGYVVGLTTEDGQPLPEDVLRELADAESEGRR